NPMWFSDNPRLRLIPMRDPPKLISFSFLTTKFGRMMMGVINPPTDQGKKEVAICLLYFVQTTEEETCEEAQQRWPKSRLLRDDDLVQSVAGSLFNGDKENQNETTITLNGTEFQQSVWTALVGLKSGETYTYTQLAEAMGRPKAVRAVANAVAKNEVSILIPCHRIVSQSGATKYHWGGMLKKQLLAFEKAQ
ncbi:hypothetical protein KR009_002844, partial [Drosophila setifemur]